MTEEQKKKTRTRVSPKRRKEVIYPLFWHFMAIQSLYPNKIPTRTLTHPLVLADMPSGSIGPNSTLQQLPLSDRRLSMTVANSYLLSTLKTCLSSSSSGLIGNLTSSPLSGFRVKTKKEYSDWHSHTHTHTHTQPQNECPPLCHSN